MTLAKYFSIALFRVVASLTIGALLLLLYTTTDYHTQSSFETDYDITTGRIGILDSNSTSVSYYHTYKYLLVIETRTLILPFPLLIV
jgi:hypothetical protein